MVKRVLCTLLCFAVLASFCGCRRLSTVISSDYEVITEYIYIDETESSQQSTSPTDATSNTPPAVEVSEVEPEQVEEIAAIIKPAEIKTTVNAPICYTYLSKEQKQMYSIIYTAASAMQEGWFSLGECSDNYLNNASIAYSSLMADRPEMFWLSKDFVVSRDKRNANVYMSLNNNSDDYECSYLFSADEVDRQKKLLQAKVEELTDATEGLSDFETELYFHDWLCNNVVYNEEGDGHIFTAYGALINGIAVCEGYSRAMQLLCNEVDIPCVVIYGSSRGSGHMWNLVCLENKWYHLDITWDDRYEILLHTYFNLNDTEINADHLVYATDVSGENDNTVELGLYNVFSLECTSNKHNYFIYKSLMLTSDYAAAARLVYEAALRGEGFVELKAIDSSVCNKGSIPITQIEEQLRLIPDCTVTIDRYSLENDVLLLLF